MKGHHTLADSSPCADCYNKMCQLNVRTIVYSSTNGEIVKQRLRDYKPKVISLGRQFINNGYNAIYRDRATERFISYEDDDEVCENSSGYDSDDTRSVSSYESGRTFHTQSTTTTMKSYTSHSSSSSSKISSNMSNTVTNKRIMRKKKQNKFINKLIKNNNKFN